MNDTDAASGEVEIEVIVGAPGIAAGVAVTGVDGPVLPTELTARISTE